MCLRITYLCMKTRRASLTSILYIVGGFCPRVYRTVVYDHEVFVSCCLSLPTCSAIFCSFDTCCRRHKLMLVCVCVCVCVCVWMRVYGAMYRASGRRPHVTITLRDMQNEIRTEIRTERERARARACGRRPHVTISLQDMQRNYVRM
jgi:hypothetical protein